MTPYGDVDHQTIIWTSECWFIIKRVRWHSREGNFTSANDFNMYRRVSNIRRTLVRDKLVDHSDVVGASPVGAAPTTSSWST